MSITRNNNQSLTSLLELETKLLYDDVVNANYDLVAIIAKKNPALIFSHIDYRYPHGKVEYISPLKYAVKVHDAYMLNLFKDIIKHNFEYITMFIQQAYEQKEYINLDNYFKASEAFDKDWLNVGLKLRELPWHLLKEFCREGNNYWSQSKFDINEGWPTVSKVTFAKNGKQLSLWPHRPNKGLGYDYSLIRNHTDRVFAEKKCEGLVNYRDPEIFHRLYKKRKTQCEQIIWQLDHLKLNHDYSVSDQNQSPILTILECNNIKTDDNSTLNNIGNKLEDELKQQSALIDVVSVFVNYLDNYIEPNIPNNELSSDNLFGISDFSLTRNEEETALNLSVSLIEAYRASLFLTKNLRDYENYNRVVFNFDEYSSRSKNNDDKKIENILYALKSHIAKLTLDKNLTELFNIFFNEISSRVINVEIKNITDDDKKIGAYWYNSFVYNKCIGYDMMLTGHTEESLSDLLLKSDPFLQISIIKSFKPSDDQSYESFVELLATYAQQGIDGAASWIIQELHYIVSKQEFETSYFVKFAIDELLLFIYRAINLPTNDHETIILDCFYNLMKYHIKDLTEEKLQSIFTQLKPDVGPANSLSIQLQATLIKVIKENRALKDLVLALNFQLMNAWLALRKDPNTHPMWREKHLHDLLEGDLIYKRLNKSYKYIQLNARLLAQAYRKNAFFKSQPEVVLHKIAAATKKHDTFLLIDAEKIARENFCKPK